MSGTNSANSSQGYDEEVTDNDPSSSTTIQARHAFNLPPRPKAPPSAPNTPKTTPSPRVGVPWRNPQRQVAPAGGSTTAASGGGAAFGARGAASGGTPAAASIHHADNASEEEEEEEDFGDVEVESISKPESTDNDAVTGNKEDEDEIEVTEIPETSVPELATNRVISADTAMQHASGILREKLKALSILPTMIDHMIKSATDLAHLRNAITDLKSIMEKMKPEDKFPASFKINMTLQVSDIAKNDPNIQELDKRWEANILTDKNAQKEILMEAKGIEISNFKGKLRERFLTALYEIAHDLTILESSKLKVIMEDDDDIPDFSKPLLSSIAFCSVLRSLSNDENKKKTETYTQAGTKDLITELFALAPKIDPHPPKHQSISTLQNENAIYGQIIQRISNIVKSCILPFSSEHHIEIGLFKANKIAMAQIQARVHGSLARNATEATQAAIDKEPLRSTSSLKRHLDTVVDQKVKSSMAKKAKGGPSPKSHPEKQAAKKKHGKGHQTPKQNHVSFKVTTDKNASGNTKKSNKGKPAANSTRTGQRKTESEPAPKRQKKKSHNAVNRTGGNSKGKKGNAN